MHWSKDEIKGVLIHTKSNVKWFPFESVGRGSAAAAELRGRFSKTDAWSTLQAALTGNRIHANTLAQMIIYNTGWIGNCQPGGNYRWNRRLNPSAAQGWVWLLTGVESDPASAFQRWCVRLGLTRLLHCIAEERKALLLALKEHSVMFRFPD